MEEYEKLRQAEIKKWEVIEATYKEEGYYDKNIKGSILVTKDSFSSSSSSSSSLSQIGHAAIMLNPNNVVEANPDGDGEVGVTSGVHLGANNWNKTDRKKTCYQALPRVEENCEVASEKQMERAANWCENQIGKHYLWPIYYDFDLKCFVYPRWKTERNKFYCSHLVWAGYKDAVDIDLAPGAISWVSPGDLLNKNYVKVIYSRSKK